MIESHQRIEARDFLGHAETRSQRLQRLVLKSSVLFASLRIEMYREALAALGMPVQRPGASADDHALGNWIS